MDSLDVIDVIALVENTFHMNIKESDFQYIKDVESLIDLIQRRTKISQKPK